jgi:hypothetical protein
MRADKESSLPQQQSSGSVRRSLTSVFSAESGFVILWLLRSRSLTEMEFIMHIAKQLAIFLDNRPGTLARVCDTLANAKRSRMVMRVSGPKKALKVLNR